MNYTIIHANLEAPIQLNVIFIFQFINHTFVCLFSYSVSSCTFGYTHCKKYLISEILNIKNFKIRKYINIQIIFHIYDA